MSSDGKTTGEGDDAIIGRALRRSMIVIFLVGVILGAAALLQALMKKPDEAVVVVPEAPKKRQQTPLELPLVPFVEISRGAGIDFIHRNGAAGEKLLPETMGSGVAWLDYDNDGDQDLLFVNSTDWPWSNVAPQAAGRGLPSGTSTPSTTSKLYSNDGRGAFTDVTAAAGLDFPLYGMGVAIGDYDNDGWCDVFLSAVGRNHLLRNVQGKFEDVTLPMGVGGAEDAWSTSCGFFDFDLDGRLDLFVCNYVQWSRETDLSQSFSIDGVHRAYGPPRAFGGTFPYLYHNRGAEGFVDISEQAGIQVRNRTTGVPLAKGMGMVPVDVNGDGYLDVVMANDTVQNFLLMNQQDGTFVESAELCGIAYDRDGNARGAMGIDAVPFREDGTLAVGIGNFANEPSALYVASSPGKPQFNDLAMATGIGPQTRLGLTFGLFFFDVDLDGRLDVLGANGHLEQEIHKVQRTQHYAQAPQLFWNAGLEGRSQLIPLTAEQTGADFQSQLVGRGAAYADFDGDGDLDVVLTSSGGPPRLLRNDQRLGNHWLRLVLQGSKANRSAIGAKVLVRAGGQQWECVVNPTRSYLSQCELPITVGLGKLEQVDEVIVRWPGGAAERVAIEGVDRVIVVSEK